MIASADNGIPAVGRRGLALAVVLLGLAGGVAYALPRLRPPPPIRIGILHSTTGPMAESERPVLEATLLAVDEIDAAGDLLGRRVEPIVVDGRSDWRVFTHEARRLILDAGVSAIFGGWTSDSRRKMRPVVEQFDHLLFYPVQYEGLEASPNIVYTGSAPNQEIIPAVKWSFETLGTRFFLVGSDYVFARVANAIVRDHVHALGGEIVGEEYLLLGSDDVDLMVRRIVESRPDVIFNTITGESNVAFFRALRVAGITPQQIPVVSASLTANKLQRLPDPLPAGDYLVASYFQSVESEASRGFVERFRQRYGQDRVISDPMEAAYFGVHLWALAVAEAGTDHPAEVRDAVKRRSWSAPQGVVYVDPENLHTWKTVRIGRIGEDRQVTVVWSSGRPVRPVPFPLFRSTEDWLALLESLRWQWGGRWDNPGVPANGPATVGP